jgi:hypothetical protein
LNTAVFLRPAGLNFIWLYSDLKMSQELVAHICNPSYSDLKPAWANISQDPILKIPNTKMDDGVAQGVGPEFKPQCCKKKKTRFKILPTR